MNRWAWSTSQSHRGADLLRDELNLPLPAAGCALNGPFNARTDPHSLVEEIKPIFGGGGWKNKALHLYYLCPEIPPELIFLLLRSPRNLALTSLLRSILRVRRDDSQPRSNEKPGTEKK